MPIKAFIIAGVILSLIGFAYWYGKSNYNAGYNAHKAEQSDATEKAVGLAQAIVSEKLNKVIAHKETERKAALKLAKQLKLIKRKVIYRDIETIKDGQCKRVGGDFVRVFNNIIGEPPGGGDKGGRDSGKSDPKATESNTR